MVAGSSSGDEPLVSISLALLSIFLSLVSISSARAMAQAGGNGPGAARAGETLPRGGFPIPRTWYSVNAATWLNVGHCRRVQPLEQTSLNCPLIGVAESTIAEISEGGGINNPHSVSAALAPLLFLSLCLNLAHYYYFIKGPFLHPLPLEDTP